MKLGFEKTPGGTMGSHLLLRLQAGDQPSDQDLYLGHFYPDAGDGVNVSEIIDKIEGLVISEGLDH